MKKMMIMMVVLCVSLAAQAVSVSWSGNAPASSFKNLMGEAMTTGADSETASILVLYMLESDYNTLTENSTKGDVQALAKASAKGQTAAAAAAAGRFGASNPWIAGSDAGIDYVARVYATFGGVEYYLDNRTGWTTAVSGNDTVPEFLSWTAGTSGTWGGATGSFGTHNVWVAPVPEPTSMALLALGVAAMGLRRRVKK